MEREPVERLRIVERQPIILPTRIEERRESNSPPVSTAPNKTIRANEPNNSKNSDNSESPVNSAPPISNSEAPEFERIGRVGRQRRYEERKNLINSVKDVVLYRHIKARHYPGLSADMRRWYEFFYFTQPMKGEKPFNANTSYEQHCEAYGRGQEWIKRHEANRIGPVGHSGPIDLQARRSIR